MIATVMISFPDSMKAFIDAQVQKSYGNVSE